MKKLIILLLLTLNISFAENISLKTGWNLIGINVNMSLIELKTQIGENNLEIIQGPNKTYQKQYVDNDKSFLNDFTNFEQGVGYWIKVTTASQITYTPESYTGEQLQTLEAGWNLINPLSTLTFDEITSKLGNDNILVIQGSTKTYQKKYVDNDKNFLNDFTTFEEGHGYWVKLLSPATLDYLFELTEQALDNTGVLVEYNIVIATKTYTIKVYTNKAPQTTNSESTIAIYGTVNGISTNSQLKLNNSYSSDTKFQVKVFDSTGKQIVLSDILSYNSSNIYFGALSIENIPIDKTLPIITLNGSSTLTLVVGSTYNELGATALDETDGVVSVQTTGTVNNNVVGSYIITYTASDVAGNTATITRTVSVISTTNETTTIDRQISLSSDDAEESISTGSIDLDSTDIEMVEDSTAQVVGLRFTNLTIPKGMTIIRAYIQFEVDETDSEDTELTFHGEKTSNASTFTTGNLNISSRVKTASSVLWNPTAWETVDSRTWSEQTVNLKTLVQEVIDQEAWQSGNALAFIISGTGKRVAKSWDRDADTAAHLYVTYSNGPVASDTTAPVITLNGLTTVRIVQGETYEEKGAIAVDNIDGQVQVKVEGNVDTSKLGTYTLTYSATDSSGNNSNLERIIIVRDSSSGKLLRGPYLQQGSNSSIIIKWRTDIASASKVTFGTNLSSLSSIVEDNSITTEHEVLLSNLNSNQCYFYTIGTPTTILAGDSETFFETSPEVGSTQSSRIWVIGDAGTKNQNAKDVYNAYRQFTDTRYTNLWLMLGDNAYDSGTDSEYQEAVFDMYPELLKQTPVWSTLGNHDNYTADVYFNIFSLPKNAEVGGVASGTESYYSFNYANIHFVVLDSIGTDTSSGSPMLEWLKDDLQNNTALWLVGVWHHPPYSKGSHDSDTSSTLTRMRENFLPTLEAYGVDFVVSGHSHSYERSKFIHGHYDVSSTFNSSHIVQAGDGKPLSGGAYLKDATEISHGTVYTVAGASGKTTSASLDHPIMEVSEQQLGSVIIDVNNTILDVKYLTEQGEIFDTFRISKEDSL